MIKKVIKSFIQPAPELYNRVFHFQIKDYSVSIDPRLVQQGRQCPMSDSLGLVDKPCFNPKRRTCSFSEISVSPVRLILTLLGLLAIPARMECSLYT